MVYRKLKTSILGMVAGASMIFGANVAFAGDWKPEKPITMVIMAGQGGGADRIARLFQSIIQKENLANMPILPVNKGGGSGAEALRFLKDNEGDAHTIMATLNSYYTTPLRTDIGVDIAEFNPLARMAMDTFVLWVNADSDIKTLDDYVAAMDYVINVAGEESVGYGTDFTQGYDKPFFEWITMDKGYARKLAEFGEIISLSGIEQIRNTGNLTAAMEKAGWKADRIAKVMGENWLRVLKDVWGK